MSSRLPALIISRVMAASSGDGVGSRLSRYSHLGPDFSHWDSLQTLVLLPVEVGVCEAPFPF